MVVYVHRRFIIDLDSENGRRTRVGTSVVPQCPRALCAGMLYDLPPEFSKGFDSPYRVVRFAPDRALDFQSSWQQIL